MTNPLFHQIPPLVPSSSLAISLSFAPVPTLVGPFAKWEQSIQVKGGGTRTSFHAKPPPSSSKTYAQPLCSGNHFLVIIPVAGAKWILGCSGDDHDYCECHHRLADGSSVREISVKAFSMAMGIRRPGFQLLSVAPLNYRGGSTSSHIRSATLADVPCLLPDQIKIYTHCYAPLGILTVFVLCWFNYKHRRFCQHHAAWAGGMTRPFGFASMRSSESPTYPKLRHNYENDVLLVQNTLDYSNGRGDEESLGLDDMYPFSSHAQHPQHLRLTPTSRRRIVDTVFSERNHSFASSKPVRPCCWSGTGQETWCSRAIKDFSAVAWPPLSVYMIISLWLFWR